LRGQGRRLKSWVSAEGVQGRESLDEKLLSEYKRPDPNLQSDNTAKRSGREATGYEV
jgi:hypothetical protein